MTIWRSCCVPVFGACSGSIFRVHRTFQGCATPWQQDTLVPGTSRGCPGAQGTLVSHYTFQPYRGSQRHGRPCGSTSSALDPPEAKHLSLVRQFLREALQLPLTMLFSANANLPEHRAQIRCEYVTSANEQSTQIGFSILPILGCSRSLLLTISRGRIMPPACRCGLTL